jgi:hypothetical protein
MTKILDKDIRASLIDLGKRRCNKFSRDRFVTEWDQMIHNE